MGQGYSDCYYVDLSLAHILDLKNHRYPQILGCWQDISCCWRVLTKFSEWTAVETKNIQ